MSSHPMNRPAPISVFSDQRRTKSTIWSRASGGTQTPVRVPQLFFLGQHAQPSVQPEHCPWSGSSSPDKRSVPVRRSDWSPSAAERQPPRSRRTPSASDRTASAGVPTHHTVPRSALHPPNAASEWRPSLPVCSAFVVSSCVRSVILTDERFLHFQLRQDITSRPHDVPSKLCGVQQRSDRRRCHEEQQPTVGYPVLYIGVDQRMDLQASRSTGGCQCSTLAYMQT